MGSSVSTLYNSLWGTKEFRILMVSLEYTGQTTILRRLKFGKDAVFDEYVPTFISGVFNIETIKYNNINFKIWDVGGGRSDKMRVLWHRYDFCQGIIFVVDSSDRDLIKKVGGEIYILMNYEGYSNVPLLIFANKQDLPNAMTVEEITDNLRSNLDSIKQDWHIQPSCAITGDGLYEGLEWLCQKLEEKDSKLNDTTS